MKMLSLTTAASILGLFAACASAQPASFRLLPAPLVANPDFANYPWRVSSSGKYVVGYYQWRGVISCQAWLWSHEGGFVTLPGDPLGGFPVTDASFVSDIGPRVAGMMFEVFPLPALVVVWDSLVAPRRLPTLGPAPRAVIPLMSADGSRVVFKDATTDVITLVVWDGGESVRRLYHFDPDLVWGAYGISRDGSTVVGQIGPTTNYARGFLLRDDEITYIEDFPGWRTRLTAYDASDGGRVVVGGGSPPDTDGAAFIWTRATDRVRLPAYTISASSVASGVSSDGRVVLGVCSVPEPRQEVFVWMAHTGTVLLSEILTRNGAEIPPRYYPWTSTELSADGTVIVGSAWNRDTLSVDGFIATIPRPCYADCNNDRALDFNDYLCFLEKYRNADPATNPIDFLYCDFNGDDAVDFNDYLEFLNLYNAGC